jgi:hypothetical protein
VPTFSILAFGRRHALGILIAIFVAVQSQIDVAHLYFSKIDLLWRSLIGRHVLEKECLEEFSQQRIGTDILAEHSPLLCELALHTADEDSNPFHNSSYP